MSLSPRDCCILNQSTGAWAFEPLALQLSASLGIDISHTPRRFNYLLSLEDPGRPVDFPLFISYEAICLAADKRLLAEAFARHHVPTPETHLFETFGEARSFVARSSDREWCLKYPTGCGASGHRMLTAADPEPPRWPTPFIVQEFIRMKDPEVYRLYVAGGELFGWIARRYPAGTPASAWVAHARGARYVRLGTPPDAALETARAALLATGLWPSFGCVDLLCTPAGKWVALEVGTDGLFNHVDRELDDPELEGELQQRIAEAFWQAARRVSTSPPPSR